MACPSIVVGADWPSMDPPTIPAMTPKRQPVTIEATGALTIMPLPGRTPISVRSVDRDFQDRACPVESWLAAIFQNPKDTAPRPPIRTPYDNGSGAIRHPTAKTAPPTAPQTAYSMARPLAALIVQARIAPRRGNRNTESCCNWPGLRASCINGSRIINDAIERPIRTTIMTAVCLRKNWNGEAIKILNQNVIS